MKYQTNNIRHFIFLLLTFCFCKVTSAQNYTLILDGIILGDSGKHVYNCNIKVVQQKNGTIISFLNNGNSGAFSTSLRCLLNDSIVVSISHVNYQDFVSKIYIDGNIKVLTRNFQLRERNNELPSVTVNAPKSWQRGDTTFFRVSAFKEGEERKLKDIVQKIPGFEIDENGNVLYKKRPIDKITVDGEDIFSDKQRLLLNNFPVHVLENLQVIQNQSENRLLKGISTENKTYLNLGLNKDKVKSAFGDGEAAYGTRNRYLLTSVLFGLYGKIKSGFIGNYNNVGTGLGWQEENELKNEVTKEAEHWSMQPKNLQVLNNFDEDRYLRNKQWDTRIQLNVPISKQIKSKSSINIFRDRISQVSSYRSTLLNDSVYFNRLDGNDVLYNPNIIQINQEVDFQGKRESLNFHASGYINRNSSSQNSFYSTTDHDENSMNTILNNWQSWTIKSSYLRKFSEKSAIEWKSVYSTQIIRQNSNGISFSWFNAFNLPDSSFDNFRVKANREFQTYRSNLAYLTKIGKNLFTTEVEFHSTKIKANNSSVVLSEKYATSIDISDLSNNGHYHNSTIALKLKGLMQIKKQRIHYKAIVGCSEVSIYEIKPNKISTLVYDINLETSFPLKKIDNKFSATLSSNQNNHYYLHQVPFPRTLSTFHSYSNIRLPAKRFDAQYAFVYAYPNSFTSSTIVLLYQRSITSAIPKVNYKQFLYIQNDSFANSPLNTFYASINTGGPSLFLKAMVHVSVGFSVSEFNYIRSDALVKSQYFFWFGNATFKKNWNKRYFLILESRASLNKLRQRKEQKDNLVDPSIINISNTLKQRWLISKSHTLFFNSQYLQNNVTKSSSNNILFIDAEWQYKPLKKAYSFSVKVDNITNQDAYYSYYNSPLVQSYYTVPLIKRNLLVSFRYEF